MAVSDAGVDAFAIAYLVKLWPFGHLALTNFCVARPRAPDRVAPSALRVSVVVPARNEAGNIPQISRRTPEMGGGTEIDLRRRTFEGRHVSRRSSAEIAAHPQRHARLFRQTGTWKGRRRPSGLRATRPATS